MTGEQATRGGPRGGHREVSGGGAVALEPGGPVGAGVPSPLSASFTCPFLSGPRSLPPRVRGTQASGWARAWRARGFGRDCPGDPQRNRRGLPPPPPPVPWDSAVLLCDVLRSWQRKCPRGLVPQSRKRSWRVQKRSGTLGAAGRGGLSTAPSEGGGAAGGTREVTQPPGLRFQAGPDVTSQSVQVTAVLLLNSRRTFPKTVMTTWTKTRSLVS